MNVGDWVLKNWAKTEHQVILLNLTEKPVDARLQGLHDFLEAIFKLESHYCRVSTTKLYLEPMWELKAHLYKVYFNEFCKEKSSSHCELQYSAGKELVPEHFF